MAKQIEFFFDFTSSASYLAWTQLPGLVERTGAHLIWKPIVLGAVFQETGNRANLEVASKMAYTVADTERCAAYLGVPLVWPPEFPVRSVPLLRGAIVAGEEGVFEPYVTAVWKAIWQEGRNLNDVAEIHTLLSSLDLDAAAFMDKTQDERIKNTLKQYTSEAVQRGVFGAPTFFINAGNDMYWGHDRMPHIEAALARM